MANMGHVLDKSFSTKLPSSETMELDESISEHKQWAKYRRQNAKAGVVLLAAQENEDVILSLQGANKLTLTCPSGSVPDMWHTLIDIFQPDDGLSEMQMEEELHALKFTKKEEPQKLALRNAKVFHELQENIN